MNRRVHLLYDDGALFADLADVRPEDGPPVSGYVVNGDWFWSRENGIEYAKSGDGVVRNQWPEHDWKVHEISTKGDQP